jgi:hypothetical protein
MAFFWVDANCRHLRWWTCGGILALSLFTGLSILLWILCPHRTQGSTLFTLFSSEQHHVFADGSVLSGPQWYLLLRLSWNGYHLRWRYPSLSDPYPETSNGDFVLRYWLASLFSGASLAGWLGGMVLVARYSRRVNASCCSPCGYDLRGSTHSARCPECGALKRSITGKG